MPSSCASTSSLSKLRLFFALWPPREAAAALHHWASAVQRTSGGRVTRLETIHLTLAFLGDVDESLLPSLKEFKVKGERQSLPIEQARFWPRNRIVWVGPDAVSEQLNLLVENLREELREKSFAVEKRPFAAHITLIRKAREPQALPDLPELSWPIDEVVLVRSQLSAAGSSYEVVQRYPLS